MINRTQEEIMQDWGVDNSDTPLVSVRCITYNHEPYIAQALDGFLMQKTNFPFEVIVHDDAGPDKTADIIREYEAKFPKIIKPIYETENQYSKHDGSLGRIVDAACKGKYIALCEGDDYWIDENKLQMQVEFLENNPDYGMCYTQAKVFNQSKLEMKKNISGCDYECYGDLFVIQNPIPTLTTCFRNELYFRYRGEIVTEGRGWLMGDYPMWLWFAKNSKIKFISKITAVYRFLDESASHSHDVNKMKKFEKSVYDIKTFYAQKYGDFNLLRQCDLLIQYKESVNHNNIAGMISTSLKIKVHYLSIKRRVFNLAVGILAKVKNFIKR